MQCIATFFLALCMAAVQAKTHIVTVGYGARMPPQAPKRSKQKVINSLKPAGQLAIHASNPQPILTPFSPIATRQL